MEAASSDGEIITMDRSSKKKKGGLRTMPFIIANEAFEKVASYGLLMNMTAYLMHEYRMDLLTANTYIVFWTAATNFLPLLGAFISDSYMGRYRTILFGSIISFLGMVILWLTAMIPQLRPPHCDPSSQTCESGVATTWQLFILIASFVFMSIGAGGVRPCSLAFGADQLVNGKDTSPNANGILQTFFNWYYASSAVAILIAMSVIVYIQEHFGWKLGFGVPATIMLLSIFSFVLASSLYVKAAPKKSLFSGFAYASVAAFRSRHIVLPGKGEEIRYHHNLGSRMVVPSDRLRFLNKACAIQNREKDVNPDGSVANKWSLCSVEQVEELKALIKVLPIWSTGIILSVCMTIPSFPYAQTSSMNRHLTKNFQVPAASFTIFLMISLSIWLLIYDRLLIPVIAKITGKPYGIGLKARMGIGIALSIATSSVSAIVESIRRSKAIKQGFADNYFAVIDMSAYWLVPQLCLGGIAEAFFAIGQNEFYYSQFPKSISSIGTSLFSLATGFGNLIAGVLVKIVDHTTKKGDVSWVDSNINRAHYDYYYWLLAIVGTVNFVYYLGCCWAYGPCDGESTKIVNKDGEDEQRIVKPKEIEMT